MIDIIGILTRTYLGFAMPAPAQAVTPPPARPVMTAPARPLPAPAPAAIHIAPLVGTPTAGAATDATTQNANAVVGEVQKFYAGIKQVTASFRQSVTNNTFGSTKTSDGTVWLMKPGKMRWDYLEKKKSATKVKKSFISNGSYLYVVEHDNKQVVKKNLENDLMPVAVTFLYGKGNLSAEFTAAIDKSGKYGAKGDIVLKMTPKKPSAQYKNLYLVVAPDNFRVKQSVIIDASNNVNQFMFYAPNFEKSLSGNIFEFDERSVKHYRIVDADQPPKGSSAGAPAPSK